MNELQTISTVSLGSDLNDQFHRNPIGQIRESKGGIAGPDAPKMQALPKLG